MSAQYFKSLFYKFSRVQTEIKKEQGRRFPNWARLLKLKKIRLSIKDRMMRIVNDGANVKLQPVRVQSGRARNGDLRRV